MGKETVVLIGNALDHVSLFDPLLHGDTTHYKRSVEGYYW